MSVGLLLGLPVALLVAPPPSIGGTTRRGRRLRVFRERLGRWQIVGIAMIALGVAVLGVIQH